MTISANFPSIRPSLLLDFANTEQLDPRITFSRPTTATYYDDNTTVVAEQNLFTRSQEFNSADWGKTATSVTADSTVAPDGTTTADTVTADGTTGSKLISASNMGSGASPATARIVSVYAKAGTNNFIQISFGGDAAPWADFDLSGGTVGSTGSNQTASIVSVGSGWYRCILYTPSTTATTVNFAIVSSSSATRNESNSLTTTVILWGAQLEQRSTVTAYTATTTAAITNYIPVLLTQQSNEARFDHNPTTRESLGLLIEEQRTNLLTYSSDYTNAVWGKTRTTITSASTVASDGTQTASLLVEDTSASTNHYVSISYSVTSGTAYTYSAYAKASGRNVVFEFAASGFGSNKQCTFDLSVGTATPLTGVTASITSVGNGWYRCVATCTATTTASTAIYSILASGTNTSYTGNGFSGIYIWGAQLEAGSFATSYIPTVASQVTRSADSASMTGANFSSWYNNAEGTVYVENSTVDTANFPTAVYMAGSTSSNSIYIDTRVTSVRAIVATNGSNVLVKTATKLSSNKCAIGYKTNSLNAAFNGETLSSDSTGNVSQGIAFLDIGHAGTGSYQNGTIKKIAYYPIRVTNAQLQGLTG